MLARHGTDEQKQRYLPELATGARRTGIALTEPGAGTDLQGIRTTARRDGDDYVVDGTKMWITNARYADPLPVLVKTDPKAEPAHKGMSILLVPADSPGFTVTQDIGKLGYKGTESCEVVLDGVRVPPGAAARRRRGPRAAAGAVLAGDRPDQHRRPQRRDRPAGLRRVAVLRPRPAPRSGRRSASSRPSSCASPRSR